MRDPGDSTLERQSRIDFSALRAKRMARALAEMARDDLDAVLLGREANARYVSGARRLWTVGARPFAPSCAVVRATGNVHVMSTWDAGIPAEVPHSRLYGMRWNPQNLMADLKKIPGLSEARRIGVDGMTPMFAKLLATTFPKAEWADASPALHRARALKLAEEVECLRAANALAHGALAAMIEDIRAGANERVLVGRFCDRAARLGATVPAFEPAFCTTSRADAGNAPRLVSRDRLLESGDWVTCHTGVLFAGYEGAVGDTRVCGSSEGPSALVDRRDRLLDELRNRVEPGASADGIAGAYDVCKEPRPDTGRLPVVAGVGLGVEPIPIPLEAGCVVSGHAWVSAPGVGGCFGRDTLHITSSGNESLGTWRSPMTA